MEFTIGKVSCNNNNVVIIAEAGVNHLGDLDLAERLIREASEAGADIIKFQTYKASDLVIKKAPRFWSWDGEEKSNGTQYDSYSKLDSFNKKEYKILFELCKKYDIEFLSTPFSLSAARMLVELGMKAFKVASCDITNIPFLRGLAKFELPILLSTGASNILEIKKAVEEIKSINSKADICIMQCTLCYPTDYKDAQLFALNHLKSEFPEILLGLSDHTLGYHVPLASIPLGARVIEKHYTVDKTLPNSADHWLSLDPKELKMLCKFSPEILHSLGEQKKIKLECETKTHKFARRSIVSTRAISKGEKIREEDLACKRPGTGIAPVYLERIVGTVAKVDIEADTLLKETDFEGA